jgi:hypothetical protein
MKPIQVALLVAVSAVAGGLFMKWQISRNMARVTSAAVKSASAVTLSTVAPAEKPPMLLVPVKSQASEPALPAAINENKTPEKTETPRRAQKVHRVQPVLIAQNVPSTPEPPAQPPQDLSPPQPVASAPLVEPQPPPAQPEPEVIVRAPAPPPQPPVQVTLRPGMLISVRTAQGLSSDRNSTGDGFTATLDRPLVVDGWVIAERGARVEGKVVQAERAGRIKGLSNLALELTQLTTTDGQRIQIQTETFEKHGQSSTGEDAAKLGAGAAIGAAIGAAAGGGKGAGIGAAVGAAAGTAEVMSTRGKPAVLPAESHVDFRIRNSIVITERQNARS